MIRPNFAFNPIIKNSTDAFTESVFPGLEVGDYNSSPELTRRCIYTNVALPGDDFCVGEIPPVLGTERDNGRGRVVVAAGFSGEGFKFAPAIGELVKFIALADGAKKVIPSNLMPLYEKVGKRFNPLRKTNVKKELEAAANISVTTTKA
jgi:hypothetical protein